MSRNYRGREFQPRWGLVTLAKPRPQEKAKQIAYLNRVIKRMNKAAGYTTEKSPHEWHYEDIEDCTQNVGGTVIAHTRSEARARIKEEWGIPKKKRLPKSVKITKGDACQT